MSAHRWIRPRLREMLMAGIIPVWVQNHPRRPYVIAAVLATPPWVDVEAMKTLRDIRDRRTASTGVKHTLDHIVPLNHPRVCGLNVPWNLQVLPQACNANKGNGWVEWHGDLFTEPEQLRLML